METERLIEIIQNEIKKDKEQSLEDILCIIHYCLQMPDGVFRDRILTEFAKIYMSNKAKIETLEKND